MRVNEGEGDVPGIKVTGGRNYAFSGMFVSESTFVRFDFPKPKSGSIGLNLNPVTFRKGFCEKKTDKINLATLPLPPKI